MGSRGIVIIIACTLGSDQFLTERTYILTILLERSRFQHLNRPQWFHSSLVATYDSVFPSGSIKKPVIDILSIDLSRLQRTK
jgi:hypothetical protein